MAESSSGGGRNRSGKGGRNRSRRRRPEPKPTGFQKFIKAITFGLVDPFEAQKKKRRSAKKKSGTGSKSRPKPSRKPEFVEPTGPRLYVGNLDYGVTDGDLRSLFSEAGNVVEASVVTHGNSGRSKGFGFVEMDSVESAKAAASKLNDHDISGRKILVTGAKSDKPTEERGPRKKREPRSESSSSGDGDRPRRERPDRKERGERRGGRDKGEREEKGARQVKPIEIEQVSSPNVLVANVNSDATEVELTDLFDGIGTVSKREATGEEGAETRDYQVEFSETAGAQRAVELLHGKSFMGRRLRVTGAAVAEVKEEAAPAE